MPDITSSNQNPNTTGGGVDEASAASRAANQNVANSGTSNSDASNIVVAVSGHATADNGQGEETLLARCERLIGYRFSDKSLLVSALTHASGAESRLSSNERLEFLGDSILGFVVCEALFRQFPQYLEGDLTKIKSVVVSRQTCAKLSEALGLHEFLIVGKGMTTTPTIPPSLKADVFESLVAAIYLDGGFEVAREFIQTFVSPEVEMAAAGELGGNFKSLLQQLAQREYSCTPNYVLMDEKGPDHAKCFKVAASIQGKKYVGAWGRNKKEAEQRAAENALAEIKGEPPPFISD
jgi:ribonuclease-3